MAKLFIQDTTLKNLGDAIRSKTGKTDSLTTAEMIAEINTLSPGAINIELTGKNDYRFCGTAWNEFLRVYGDGITTRDMTSGNCMFHNNNEITEIPFDLNFTTSKNLNLQHLFCNCQQLEQLPDVNIDTQGSSEVVLSLYCTFANLRRMRHVPDSIVNILSNGNIYKQDVSPLFSECYSLRTVPAGATSRVKAPTHDLYNVLFGIFDRCYALDEATNIFIGSLIDREFPKCEVESLDNGSITNTSQRGVFNGGTSLKAFDSCMRLKELTFAYLIPGTPYPMKWAGQTLDLTANVGWARTLTLSIDGKYVSYDPITHYNSGITEDKKVTDSASYQALKDDPDWYTMSMYYSRYNKTSAVNTINSLPNCSEYLNSDSTLKANTIKFKGNAGRDTDGGAINTMTEEQIAVATAKGWTVSFS